MVPVKWLKWFVSLPIRFMHGSYNHLSMAYCPSINEVISRQIYSGNSINALQFLFGKNFHIFSSKGAISAVAKCYRNDPRVQGFFEVEKDDIFINFLKDLYSEMEVDVDAFLLTCSQEHVNTYKNPLLKYVNKSRVKRLEPEISKIADNVLDFFLPDKKICARDLPETYTVSVLTSLFLNHPGNLSDFQKIGKAASFAVDYQFIKNGGLQMQSSRRKMLRL